MEHSEKFKEAMEVIIAAIKNETGDEGVDSIELVVKDTQEEKGVSSKPELSTDTVLILRGVCRWDKKKRKVVCQ